MGGDYLALRFDTDPALVVWLDHEAGYDVGRAKVICSGLREFVMRWASLGFPDLEDAIEWVDDAQSLLVHDDQRAKAWHAWLAGQT